MNILSKISSGLSKLHPGRFWSTESGLSGMLIFSLGYLIVLFSLSDFFFGMLVARLFFSLIILAGVLATLQQRWLRSFAVLLAIASLTLNWVSAIRPWGPLTIVNIGLNFIYLGFLLTTTVLQVFQEGPVSSHRIRGAIVIYLLMGALWSLLYQLLASTIPQAFRLPEDLGGSDPHALQRLLIYFSFITLTSTGYGDIIPVHPVARLLAMFEALAGQLYLAIILARLVSLAVMHQKEKS
jgi:Ion channel